MTLSTYHCQRASDNAVLEYLLHKYGRNEPSIGRPTQQRWDKQTAGDVNSISPAGKEEEEQKEQTESCQAEFTFKRLKRIIISSYKCVYMSWVLSRYFSFKVFAFGVIQRWTMNRYKT